MIDSAEVGAPKHRLRAIVILTRTGREFGWPSRTPSTTAWDAIGLLDQSNEEIPAPQGKWADLLPSIPEGENYLWHTDRGGGKPLFGYRTRYWSFLLKLAKNRPSWTVPAHPGPATGPLHWDNRPLSVPELLRLQTFPADWRVEGPRRLDRVRQVGNATPPLLAEALGRCLMEHLGRPPTDAPLAYSIPRSSEIPPAGPVEPVAIQYRGLIGDHEAHPGPGLGPGRRAVAS
jgi:DNA (cytosine-5)-methyltransferase 1